MNDSARKPMPPMTILDWARLDEGTRVEALERPAVSVAASVDTDVAAILARVRSGGDEALFALTEELDGVRLDRLDVTPGEFERAEAALTARQRAAIVSARDNIRRFHAPQVREVERVETAPGVHCERHWRAIDAVGLYVPAGTAPLPSTVLMLGVPAALAGCELRVLCAPPRPDGSLDPAILTAARLCGIERVFKLGGAQAVAAMAYGTDTVPSTSKIFGPGNAWVTAAKRLVALDHDGAAADMPAGPSEVLVIADDTADADFVAADLLSQAEHGPDSQVVLVSTSRTFANAVVSAVGRTLPGLGRASIARRALEHARLIVVADLDEAMQISNAYAPEHLILQTAAPRALLPRVRNAGSVFLGPWSPEAIGDYCSGTNHVLPTYGHARAYSGLSVDAFMRSVSVQELRPEGLAGIGPVAVELARLEGLDAHAHAVEVRLRHRAVAGEHDPRAAAPAPGGSAVR